MEYYTHDNGGISFKVVISQDNTVTVYQSTCEDEQAYYPDPVKVFAVSRVFIGKDEKYPVLVDRETDGNSILLNLTDNNYVFIGNNIHQFQALSNIVEYFSPIGNSDVPYPFAIDDKNNYYLMTEEVILLNSTLRDGDDPYDYYYKYFVICDTYGGNITYRDLQTFYINGNEYGLTYQPHASQKYDQYGQYQEEKEDDIPLDVPDSGVFLRTLGGTLKPFNKQEYIDLINEVGTERNFQSLGNTVLVKRPGWD